MRIISGKHKGRKIKAPVIEEIRPTTDFAKTGLFNVLNNFIDYEQVSVLDLCTGFGNIALEFASRGAVLVDAVDVHPQAIRFIKNFSSAIQLPVNVYQSDVIQFLKRCYQKYDIIFADPPFDAIDILDDVMNIVTERKLLKPNGIIIFEHNDKVNFSGHPYLFDERKYGKVRFSFFRME
jgi:16S rRNA (guanine(966)-N(2))-methyltransferase RsmD